MRALNIDASGDLVENWVGWFAPRRQPFLVESGLAASMDLRSERSPLPAELRDTYEVYDLPEGLGFAWLDEEQFLSLPRTGRAAMVRAQRRFGREHVPSVKAWASLLGNQAREQADGHRFVWWPSLLVGMEQQVLTDYIEQGRRPSRHDVVPDHTWTGVMDLLPGAQLMAGRFATASGPNCFGTVMAAAGVPGADSVWMQREPFEHWLTESARTGGSDTDPGTVMVWRSRDGLAQHAAVTIGSGWALHKPSQGWFDPVKILSISDVKRSARSVGRLLQRYALGAPDNARTGYRLIGRSVKRDRAYV